MVGAVGKIPAFQPKVPGSILGSAEIWTFVRPTFPPKLTQLSIFPLGVGKWVPASAGS